jgi:(p)ppGpp synthase/HD superfamily hydrolase
MSIPTTPSPFLTLGFRFEMALVYAFQLHGAQTRKGGSIPYIGHLLGVASTVIEAGGDEDQAIAALLHDAIEDQDCTSEQIESIFGPRVARIVVNASDGLDPAGRRLPRDASTWRQRKEQYLAHLRDADRDTLLIALADKLYNARSILHGLHAEGESVWNRFNQSKEQQLWYLRALVDTFKTAKIMGVMGPVAMILLKELIAVVVELGA